MTWKLDSDIYLKLGTFVWRQEYSRLSDKQKHFFLGWEK